MLDIARHRAPDGDPVARVIVRHRTGSCHAAAVTAPCDSLAKPRAVRRNGNRAVYFSKPQGGGRVLEKRDAEEYPGDRGSPADGNCPDRETAIDSDILELAGGVLGRSAVPC
ncbi:hypothetical protein DdX_22083 [Ditylenchus destructor]|uniref:Uncharacterized protein n=1 Tax=Ditylenchus destructor TaxID=166010 RepID=A0AAD4QUQ2_9BILA|nr:hypothetical protein DdX_22083 [Ditylenchus destructor]